MELNKYKLQFSGKVKHTPNEKVCFNTRNINELNLDAAIKWVNNWYVDVTDLEVWENNIKVIPK